MECGKAPQPATEVAQTPSTLAVLKAAEAWLSDPKRWTQGAYWHDCDGHLVLRRDEVVSTCAVGALTIGAALSDPRDYPPAAYAALNDAAHAAIILVNDEPDGYARVMAAYRRAITKLEQAA